MDKEKVANLFKNKEFLKKLFKLKAARDIYKSVREIFRQNGVELTIEEIEEVCDIIDVCTSGYMVLSDGALGKVIGGVAQTGIMDIFNENIDKIRDVITNIDNSNKNDIV